MLTMQVLPDSLQEALRQTPEEAHTAGVDPTTFAAIAEARCIPHKIYLKILPTQSPHVL